MRGTLRVWILAGWILIPSIASAQDHDFPVLNSVGRFLGYGHSQTGYQSARDGRLNGVVARHPASNYASGQLLHPYSAGYQPQRPARPYYGQPQTNIIQQPSYSVQPTPAPNLRTAPAVVPQPEQWLVPKLLDKPAEEVSPIPQTQPPAGELLPPATKPSNKAPFRIDPDSIPSPSDLMTSPSDGLLDDDGLLENDGLLEDDSGDLLLEDDDDDLLLIEDDEDLSARRRVPQPLNWSRRLPSRTTSSGRRYYGLPVRTQTYKQAASPYQRR